MIRHLITVAAASVALSLVAAAPAQQTQPAAGGQGGAGGPGGGGGGGGGGGASSPFWRTPAEVGDREVEGFPATLAGQIPSAAAANTELHLRHRQAKAQLDEVIREKTRRFNRTPEVQDARRAEADAWDDYQQARREMLDRLRRDEDYLAALVLQKTIATKIRAEHGRHAPDRDRLVELADLKLNYGQTRSEMERAAGLADGELDSARRRFIEAGRELSRMRDDFREDLRDDPQVLELRGIISDLDVLRKTARTYERELRRVANTSLDFSYFRLRAIYGPSPYSPFGFYDDDDFYGGYGLGGFGGFGLGFGPSGFVGGGDLPRVPTAGGLSRGSVIGPGGFQPRATGLQTGLGGLQVGPQ